MITSPVNNTITSLRKGIQTSAHTEAVYNCLPATRQNCILKGLLRYLPPVFKQTFSTVLTGALLQCFSTVWGIDRWFSFYEYEKSAIGDPDALRPLEMYPGSPVCFSLNQY